MITILCWVVGYVPPSVAVPMAILRNSPVDMMPGKCSCPLFIKLNPSGTSDSVTDQGGSRKPEWSWGSWMVGKFYVNFSTFPFQFPDKLLTIVKEKLGSEQPLAHQKLEIEYYLQSEFYKSFECKYELSWLPDYVFDCNNDWMTLTCDITVYGGDVGGWHVNDINLAQPRPLHHQHCYHLNLCCTWRFSRVILGNKAVYKQSSNFSFHLFLSLSCGQPIQQLKRYKLSGPTFMNHNLKNGAMNKILNSSVVWIKTDNYWTMVSWILLESLF